MIRFLTMTLAIIFVGLFTAPTFATAAEIRSDVFGFKVVLPDRWKVEWKEERGDQEGRWFKALVKDSTNVAQITINAIEPRQFDSLQGWMDYVIIPKSLNEYAGNQVYMVNHYEKSRITLESGQVLTIEKYDLTIGRHQRHFWFIHFVAGGNWYYMMPYNVGLTASLDDDVQTVIAGISVVP